MPTTEIIENYRYHRARNIPQPVAHWAIKMARADLAKVPPKRRYGACSPLLAYGRRNAEGEGFVENARDTLRVVYTGGYRDAYQDSKMRGVVVRLSHNRCFPGYEQNDDCGIIVDWSDCRDNARDAAHAADNLAERNAEREREYQTAWQAGSLYASRGEEISDLRKAAIALIAHLRSIRHDPMPTVAAIIRENVCEKLARIRKFRVDRSKLIEGDFGDLCFYPDARLRGAFNEGAGPMTEDYARRNKMDVECIEVRSMDERVAADNGDTEVKYS